MAGGGVTGDAGEIQPLLVHVHVQVFARMLQRTVEVAVFRTVGACTEEVAGTAVAAAGHADALRHFLQVGGSTNLPDPFGNSTRLYTGCPASPGSLR